MWRGNATDISYESVTSVLCKQHQQLPNKIPNIENYIKKKRKVFLYLKIHIMDPFFFQKKFDLSGEIMQSGCFAHVFCTQSGMLPKDGYYRHGHLNKKVRETIMLFDSVITYTLSLLLQDCIICKKYKSEDDFLENIAFEDLRWLHKLHGKQNLEDIIDHIVLQPPYIQVQENFTVWPIDIVNTAFLIAYISFHMLRNRLPAIPLYNLEEEMKDLEIDIWKHTGNEEYRKKNYLEAAAAYTNALKHRPYSNILFGNRAQAYLKLHKYEEAELDSRAAVTLCPEWCKGYFKLASALVGQKNIHQAHMVASFGLQNTENSICQEYDTLMEYKEKIEKECKKSNNCFKKIIGSQGNKYYLFTNEIPQFDDIEDIPELTDSSNSDSSENEAEKTFNSGPISNDVSENIEAKTILNSDIPINLVKEKHEVQNVSSKTKSEVSSSNAPGPKNKRKIINIGQKSEELSSNVPGPKNKLDSVNVGQKPEEPSPNNREKKLHDLQLSLKEGSSAITDGRGHIAVNCLFQALTEIKLHPELYKFDECNMVCLKYAYGSACCKSGSYEDLEKAIEIFQDILKEHSTIRFPAAYYGLGLAYFKLNRFKDAVHYFKTAYSIIEKGVNCKVFCWPGTNMAIEETKSGKLKVFLEDFIEKSECPPPPDAKCCYEHCSTRTCIYYTDPDFKGFTLVHCHERCVLHYHPSCWKSLKETFSLTDKEFLDFTCLTPDCGGSIVHVESIGRDGVIEKSFHSEESEKSKKNVKQKKSKLEKRFEMKELRKRKRHESLTLHSVNENHEAPEDSETSGSVKETGNSREITPDKIAMKEAGESTVQDDLELKQMCSNLSANAKPFYVIKKDIECKEAEHNTPKKKEQKKKSRRPALSLDEFCADQTFSYYTEYQFRLHRLQESRRVVEEDDSHWPMFCESEMSRIPQLDPLRPFHIPEDLRDNPDALEAVLQSYGTPTANETAKAIKENIYSYLEHILSFRGPLRFKDPELVEEVDNFPPEAKQLISDCGGFREFMTQSMRFAIVGDHICVISDVLKAYTLSHKTTNGQGYSDCNDDLDEFYQGDGTESANSQSLINKDESDDSYSHLNPNAVEYNPTESKNEQESTPDDNKCDTLDTFGDSLKSPGNSVTEKKSCSKVLFPDSCVAQISSKKEEVNALPTAKHSLCKSCKISPSLACSNAGCAKSSVLFPIRNLDEDSNKLRNVLDVIEQYFQSSPEDFVQFTNGTKPFVLKKVHKKLNKCLQVELPDDNMASQALITEINELKQALENSNNLAVEKAELEEEKKLLEVKLEIALDTVTKLQNKGLVEKSVLQKELEDAKLQHEAEKKQFRTKQKYFESEQKRFQQNQSKMADDEKSYKQELEKSQATIESLKSKNDDLENKHDTLVSQAVSYSVMIEETKKKCSEVTNAFKKMQSNFALVTQRAEKAELDILNLKMNDFVLKVDENVKNCKKNIIELEEGISNFQKSLQPLVVNSLQLLLTKLREHVNCLSAMKSNFCLVIEDQINEVKKGKPLSDLKPFEIPTLPPIPVLSDISCMPSQNNSHMFPPPATNQLTNEQLQKHIQDFYQSQLFFPSTGSSNAGQSVNSSQIPAQDSTNPCIPTNFPNQGLKNCVSINKIATPSVNATLAQKQSIYNQIPNLSLQQLVSSIPHAEAVTPFGPIVPRGESATNLAPISWSSWERQPEPVSKKIPQNVLSSSYFKDPNKILPKSWSRASSLCAGSNLETDDARSVTSYTSLPPVLNEDSIVSCPKLQSSEGNLGAYAMTSTDANTLNIEKKYPAVNKLESSIVDSDTASESDDISSVNRFTSLSLAALKKSFSSYPTAFASNTTTREEHTKNTIENSNNPAKDKQGTTAAAIGITDLENVPVELGYTTAKDDSREGSISSIETYSKSPTPGQQSNQKYSQKKDSKNSYEKLFEKLQSTFSNCTKSELMEYVTQFRKRQNNKLSGLTLDSIVTGVGAIIYSSKKLDHPMPMPATQPKVQSRPRVLVNRPLVSQLPTVEKHAAPPECPWAKSNNGSNSAPWSGENKDNSCIICFEEMTRRNAYRVDCGHRFHLACIREWLNKTSNCPVCRVHLLLPEDYPALH